MKANTSMLENFTFQDFLNCAKDKDIVCFGSGRYLPLAKKLLGQYGLNIAYAVDNNFWRNGTCVEGIQIYTLEKLINRASCADVCVLICAADVFGIESQIQKLGINHYFALPLFIKELCDKGLTVHANISFDPIRNNAGIGIMIVNQCNLRCPMCRLVQNSTGEIMSTENYSQILDQCKGLNIMGQTVGSIRLDGNREALLHPNFSDIVYKTKEKGFKASIVTNGVLLSAKKAKVIAADVDSIAISVTGITPETYCHFQGANSINSIRQFNTVVKNVSELVEIRNRINSKCKIQISFIYTEHSVHEAKDAVFFWKNIGVDDFIIHGDEREQTHKLENASEKEIGYKGYPNGGGMCVSSAVIAANGDVFPCCRPGGEYMPIGNCFESPLCEIFGSSEYFRLVHSLASLDRKRLPLACRTCSSFSYIV